MFSVAHVAGHNVNSVITPVTVNTKPSSPGPHAKVSSAWSGTKVARVPARVIKMVPVTNAIARKGPLRAIRAASRAGLSSLSLGLDERRVSGRRKTA